MKIDIASMARASGIRKSRITMRAISPTQVQARALYRVYLPVVVTWETQIRDRLMPEYSRTIAGISTDSVIDIEAIIRFIEEQVAILIQTEIRSGIMALANQEAEWHFRRFVANLKYATNVDLSTVLGPQGSQLTMQDFLVRNTALIRDVSDQTRGRIADIVFRNIPLRTPARDVAREISEATGLARKRALNIARDQTQKISGSLDAERGIQIGAPGYDWMHSAKAHPRLEHLARDGKYFAFGSEVDRTDPPGYAVFCGCKRRIALKAPE